MVPISKNHLRNTTGGSFTAQKQGGTIIGLSSPTSKITKAIMVKDVNASDTSLTTGPRALSGNRTYNATKILSSGTFAYNAAKNKTWIISRITTSLSGVSNSVLLSMGSAIAPKSFPYYGAKYWINNASLVRKSQYSKTGYDSSGNKIKKRTTWITNPTGTQGTDFGTSLQVPTRTVPGKLVILTNFVDYNSATSTNYYNYKPITGK